MGCLYIVTLVYYFFYDIIKDEIIILKYFIFKRNYCYQFLPRFSKMIFFLKRALN